MYNLGSMLLAFDDYLIIILLFSLRSQNHSYIQHKLPEPKATYISSNYSTAILQHKGQSPAANAEGLNIFLSHAVVHTDTALQTHGASGDKLPPLLNNLLLHRPTSLSLR